ncbi:hypothetical protein [uncultured Helicobacter sp.]|uniref:hypothetical protein n=1 Tax=uncultured Helicobacter sp. TaxID=175537 RepID=UPI003751ADBE
MKKTTLAALFGILTLGQVCLAQEAGQEATTKQNVALEKKEHNTQADPNKGHEITTGDNGIYTTMTIPGLTSFTFDNGLSTSYFNFDIRAGYWYMINDYLVARGGIGIGLGAMTSSAPGGNSGGSFGGIYVPLEAEIGLASNFYLYKQNPALAIGLGAEIGTIHKKAEVYARVRVPYTEGLSIKLGYGFYGDIKQNGIQLDPSSVYSIMLIMGF